MADKLKTIRLGEQVNIPVEVVICPVCGGQIAAEVDECDSETKKPTTAGFYIDCLETQATDPQRDHYRHLTYQETVELSVKVYAWLKDNVRVILDEPLELPEDWTAHIKGTWPANDLRRAFVMGAAWWEFHSRGATMWPSDRALAEEQAEKTFPNGLTPDGKPAAGLQVRQYQVMGDTFTVLYPLPVDMTTPSPGLVPDIYTDQHMMLTATFDGKEWNPPVLVTPDGVRHVPVKFNE